MLKVALPRALSEQQFGLIGSTCRRSTFFATGGKSRTTGVCVDLKKKLDSCRYSSMYSEAALAVILHVSHLSPGQQWIRFSICVERLLQARELANAVR